jgi:hypothetical protein
LTLPNGALPSDTDITLTPVTAVNRSPLSGGLVGAVEIRPHGLQLLQTATLTIEPGGSAGPIAGQTGFLSHESGEDFHLYPLEVGPGLQLKLTHFSTPGVAQATDADRQFVLSHPPERHQAQYAQMVAEVLREARIAAEAGEDGGLPADTLAAILRGYYRDVVSPLVERAYNDDTVAAQALSELLSWARQVQLLGLQDHPGLRVLHDAMPDMIEAILANAVDQAYERCVDHDLDSVVRLIGLARIGQLLGYPLGTDAADKAERCATFKLDFDSRFTQSQGWTAADGRTAQTDALWHVKAARQGRRRRDRPHRPGAGGDDVERVLLHADPDVSVRRGRNPHVPQDGHHDAAGQPVHRPPRHGPQPPRARHATPRRPRHTPADARLRRHRRDLPADRADVVR